MFLISDYSLIADLHIFVYGSAECTKVKLLILNNFDKISFEPAFKTSSLIINKLLNLCVRLGNLMRISIIRKFGFLMLVFKLSGVQSNFNFIVIITRTCAFRKDVS